MRLGTSGGVSLNLSAPGVISAALLGYQTSPARWCGKRFHRCFEDNDIIENDSSIFSCDRFVRDRVMHVIMFCILEWT